VLGSGCDAQRLSADAADCRTLRHKTRGIEAGDEVLVAYAWHPWAGVCKLVGFNTQLLRLSRRRSRGGSRDSDDERRVDGSNGRSLDGFLRLFGVRCGLLYPQQKNPNKRLVPADRTLEVLAVSTFDAVGQQLEYRDFLDALHDRWRIVVVVVVVGGRPEDGALLATAGAEVDSASLA